MTVSLPTPYRTAAVLACLVALAGAGFYSGWTINGWRVADERAQALAATVKQRDAAIGERDRLADKLAAKDSKATKELKRLKDENDSLRDAVAAGARVVRVPGAVCPAPDVPETPARGGVDSGTGAVLDAQAGQDFFSLRADAIRVGAKLAACQDALATLTGQ